jgi:hypothetical protein
MREASLARSQRFTSRQRQQCLSLLFPAAPGDCSRSSSIERPASLAASSPGGDGRHWFQIQSALGLFHIWLSDLGSPDLSRTIQLDEERISFFDQIFNKAAGQTCDVPAIYIVPKG